MVNPFEDRLKSRPSGTNPFEKRLKERNPPTPYGPREGLPFQIEPPTEEEKERSLGQRVKEYFTKDKFGESLAIQRKTGGFAGAPALYPEEAKDVATEAATIAAIEAVYAPVIGAAAASQFAPKTLTSLARLTQAASTGAGVTATKKLVNEGELPSPEELIEEGATWMAIDAAMQALHLTAAGGKKIYDFGRAVSNIAETEGIPKVDVLRKLWDSSKNYLQQQKGKIISDPSMISPVDVEVLVEEAKTAEKNLPKISETIDITPEKETLPSGLSKPKSLEHPYTSKALISPERQKKTLQAIDEEAASLARQKVEKHLPMIKQIEEGFDFENKFSEGFAKVRKIAQKHPFDIDITDISDYLSFSRKKMGSLPKELFTTEQKKILNEIRTLRNKPQTSLKNLLDLFRLNNKKRSAIYERRHVEGKQKEYTDFLTGLNKSIVKSLERTFPENSQWLNYFKNLNNNYSRYLRAKETMQMLEGILHGKPTPAFMNKLLVNPKMQKKLALSMGQEGAKEIIQLVKDMKMAREAIKTIPTKKLREMDAIYPLGLVIPGLKIPTAIVASKKIYEYGQRAFGWYLTTPDSTEILDKAVKAITTGDISAYKKAAKDLKKD